MAKQKSTEPQETTAPKLNLGGKREFHQHIFKLEIARMQKNNGWKKYEPILRPVEHVHFFRTCSTRNVPLKKCVAVGGHFHEMTWSIGSDGTPVAKCGPAMREVARKLPSGRVVKVVQPVTFQEETHEGIRTITDTHTHEVNYLATDVLSADIKKTLQARDKAAWEQKFKPQMEMNNTQVELDGNEGTETRTTRTKYAQAEQTDSLGDIETETLG